MPFCGYSGGIAVYIDMTSFQLPPREYYPRKKKKITVHFCVSRKFPTDSLRSFLVLTVDEGIRWIDMLTEYLITTS